ncbi:TPA: type I methionyl aminopeptidase [bacterium]|nr:type I methionyl aminopeptidase [bacterium]
MILKSEEEVERMRVAGKIVANCLKALEKVIEPGIPTEFLNIIADKEIRKMNGIPAFLGYRGFPKSICISLNEEVIHGISEYDRLLKDGDLLKIDIGVYYKGYCADAARTYVVGNALPLHLKLKKVAEDAFEEALSSCKIGGLIRDISSSIENYVKKCGFSVVREFGGHGIGKHLHEAPEVLNYVSNNGNIKIKEGMTFCIEPMVNEGTWEVEILSNGWTVVTKDRKLSSHYENTVAITKNGVEILTR